jgi:hypothetical protein
MREREGLGGKGHASVTLQKCPSPGLGAKLIREIIARQGHGGEEVNFPAKWSEIGKKRWGKGAIARVGDLGKSSKISISGEETL